MPGCTGLKRILGWPMRRRKPEGGGGGGGRGGGGGGGGGRTRKTAQLMYILGRLQMSKNTVNSH